MPSRQDSETTRRLLIAAGTAQFRELADLNLPLVPQELDRISHSLASLGYDRQQRASSLDPSKTQIQKALEDLRNDSRADDLIVVYYTGHGVRDNERFYLLVHDSIDSDYDTTALPAEDLARLLTKNSKASQIMVMLDTCYAGAGAAEFSQIVHDLAGKTGGGPSVFVMAAARPKQEAQQGAFSAALALALANRDEQLGGATQAYLAIDEVMEAVDGYLSKHYPTQIASWSSANVRGRCRIFPNPHFNSQIRSGLDLDTQRSFLNHWLPKARGASLDVSGWYFTGRRVALRDLVTWLSGDTSLGYPHVVTGGAGSGKSALLARLVTLADRSYRQEVLAAASRTGLDPRTVPPEGIIDVAVHARHKLLSDVTKEIAARLSLDAADPSSLISAISQLGRKVVIVLDALDEAVEPDQISIQLLRPLAEHWHVFLLIGSRPDSTADERFRTIAKRVIEIDLDDERYIEPNDVRQYVLSRLLATEEPGRLTPYNNLEERAEEVASAIAECAKNVFLVAHTAVQALLATESAVDTTEVGWIDRLPTGVDEAFDQFLSGLFVRSRGSVTSSTARAVLLPLAFAEGEGLPWADIWSPVATSLSGLGITDIDISNVRRFVAAFIVEASEHDRSVYRLYHESIAKYLRGSLEDDRAAQERIVACLLDRRASRITRGRVSDWSDAHPYLLNHLAAHALKAGILAELVADIEFLICADAERLYQALSNSTDSRSAAVYTCYSIAFERIRDQLPDVRLARLQMIARQQGYETLADHWNVPDRLPWFVQWANWQAISTHRSFSTIAQVEYLKVVLIDDRPSILAALNDESIQVWDITTGTILRELPSARFGFLTNCNGRPTAIVVDRNRLKLMDIMLGTYWDEFLAIENEQIDEEITSIALGQVHDQPVAITGSFGGGVRIWEVKTGWQHIAPATRWKERVTSIALVTDRDKPIVLIGSARGRVDLLELDSGAHRTLVESGSGVISIVVGEVDKQSLAVSGGQDGVIHVWNLAASLMDKRLLQGHVGEIRSLLIGVLEGLPTIFSGGSDGTIRLWDPNSGVQRGEPLVGHEGDVAALALLEINNRPVLVSGGRDLKLRVWDLNARHLSDRQTTIGVSALTCGTIDGKDLVVAGCTDGIIRFFDLASGKMLGRTLQGLSSAVTSVVLARIDDRAVILSASADRKIRIWDYVTGAQHFVGNPIEGPRRRAWFAIGALTDKAVVISRSDAQHVQDWRLALDATALVEDDPLRGCVLGISPSAFGTINDMPIAVLVENGTTKAVIVILLESGAQLRRLYCEDWISSVALGYLGESLILVFGSGGKVHLWDLSSDKKLVEPQSGLGASSVAFAILNERPVVVSSGGETLHMWDLETGEVLRSEVGSTITGISVSNDAIIVGTRNGILSLRCLNTRMN
ncbi:caspase family protein [Bradyrhizobium commune]|uniref:Caspase family protein n=1 Tax=Bradyrhizobium commune TaxID=83627 RepID=A0A7S9GYE2_9BRAD|nr:caspase family protein [Bradyrhizobium commune]QPF89500.1 caspase family protein [Bradyrhizobium commune]